MARDPQRLLDALASPIRREILWLVRSTELAVGEIASAFEVSAPTISQHLAVLRDSDLVEMRVDGNFRRYLARTEALRGLESLLADDSRWLPATDVPEAGLAAASTEVVVRAWIDVDMSSTDAFDAFTDAAKYSAWLGVPVAMVDGRFSCTMEWGTRIRGSYDIVVSPSLIVMRWDFEDDNVPVPGEERTAYLRIEPTDDGCHVEVHQMVAGQREADFMHVAWRLVLGRFAQAHRQRHGKRGKPGAVAPRVVSRSRRPKRR